MKKKEKKLVRLDIACGNNKQKGFIGLDITKEGTQADLEVDLMNFPWKPEGENVIQPDTVDEIFCSHYIEHIPHGNGYHDPLFDFMDEVYRILKPGGTAIFITPYFKSVRAFQDPTHLRMITEMTYQYFTKAWRKLNRLEHYPVKCDFEIVKIDHAVSEEYTGKAQEAVMSAAMHFWDVIMDLQVTLKKPKTIENKKEKK